MTGYYCLAETTVNGEVIVQGNSATYSARTSGSATSDVSFEDAAKIATAASNATALVVGRAEVEKLLKQYAYVLSDLEITEMVTNNLRTQVLKKLKVVLLETIANSVDGRNFTLKKNVQLSDEILQIPDGYTLKNTGKYKLDGGTIQIGGRNRLGTTGNASYSQDVTETTYTSTSDIYVNSFDNTSTYNVTGPTTYLNQGSITVGSGGSVQMQSVTFVNDGNTTSTGYVEVDTGSVGFNLTPQ